MTRKSKPRRSCKICKPHKYMGNNPLKRPVRDRRRLQDDLNRRGAPLGRGEM